MKQFIMIIFLLAITGCSSGYSSHSTTATLETRIRNYESKEQECEDMLLNYSDKYKDCRNKLYEMKYSDTELYNYIQKRNHETTVKRQKAMEEIEKIQESGGIEAIINKTPKANVNTDTQEHNSSKSFECIKKYGLYADYDEETQTCKKAEIDFPKVSIPKTEYKSQLSSTTQDALKILRASSTQKLFNCIDEKGANYYYDKETNSCKKLEIEE